MVGWGGTGRAEGRGRPPGGREAGGGSLGSEVLVVIHTSSRASAPLSKREARARPSGSGTRIEHEDRSGPRLKVAQTEPHLEPRVPRRHTLIYNPPVEFSGAHAAVNVLTLGAADASFEPLAAPTTPTQGYRADFSFDAALTGTPDVLRPTRTRAPPFPMRAPPPHGRCWACWWRGCAPTCRRTCCARPSSSRCCRREPHI